MIEPGVPELVEGDPVRLRQVLINLINNAIKFTHKGKVITEVKLASKSADEALLMFSVIDNGIGIPKDKQGSVFEVFTQADSSTSRRFGGSGLGLAISKRLVEMMGGRIWVESEPGVGSTFSFTASFKKVDAVRSAAFFAEQKDAAVNVVSSVNLKDVKILLAEDNIVNQRIAARMLEKQGCIVTTVDNGQEAVNKTLQEHFDLVLMDAYMPVLDGLEATAAIRDHEKNTGRRLPIIALTARAMQEDRKKCIDAGMDGYIAKPIDRKKMFEEIATVLSKGMKYE